MVASCVISDSDFKIVPSKQGDIGLTPSYEALASKTISIDSSDGTRSPGFESWRSLPSEVHNSPIFKKHRKNKFILYLNWKEIHRERKTVVVQNKYVGEKYGTDPFQGKTKL